MDLFKNNKNLKNLSEKDFDGKKIKNVKTGGILLVFAQWCIHCQNLKPIWNNLSKVKGNVEMFIIDEAKNKNLIQTLGVKSFPSIFKVLKNGSLKMYSGQRDMISLVNLLCDIDKKNKVCKT